VRRKNIFFLLEMADEERQTPVFRGSHVKTPWNKYALA
jgi:hypothetical protein